MTKAEARKIALREAGAWLTVDADCNDLDDSLSEVDEDKIRAQIRLIAESLLQKGYAR